MWQGFGIHGLEALPSPVLMVSLIVGLHDPQCQQGSLYLMSTKPQNPLPLSGWCRYHTSAELHLGYKTGQCPSLVSQRNIPLEIWVWRNSRIYLVPLALGCNLLLNALLG